MEGVRRKGGIAKDRMCGLAAWKPPNQHANIIGTASFSSRSANILVHCFKDVPFEPAPLPRQQKNFALLPILIGPSARMAKIPTHEKAKQMNCPEPASNHKEKDVNVLRRERLEYCSRTRPKNKSDCARLSPCKRSRGRVRCEKKGHALVLKSAPRENGLKDVHHV